MMRPNTLGLLSGLTLLLVGAAVGCAGSTVVSENPVTHAGATLAAERPSRDDAARTLATKDALAVEATPDRLCVHTVRLRALPLGAPPATLASAGDDVLLRSDGDARTLHLSSEGAPTAAGTIAGADGKTMQLWRLSHAGCTANGGLLTPTSPKLVLDPGQADEVEWLFTVGAPERRI